MTDPAAKPRRASRPSDPTVREAYDRLSDTYDQTYRDAASAAEDRLVGRLLNSELRALTAERGRPRVLDVGCGTGWFADHNRVPLETYRGFDLSGGMLLRATGKDHLTRDALLWEGDLNEPSPWCLPHHAFDLVVSTFASPSYAHDPATFLRRCRDSLTLGGRVFLMPHAEGYRQRQAYLDPDAYGGDEPWSAREARELLEASGFTVPRDGVRGLRHPTAGPGDHRPRWAHDAWLAWEHRRYAPDDLSFLLLRATRVD